MNRPNRYYEVVTRWVGGSEQVWICWTGAADAVLEARNNRAHPACVSSRVYFVRRPERGRTKRIEIKVGN